MKTYLECIPCFFNQCIQIGKKAGLSEEGQKMLIDKIALTIPEISATMTPPEIAGIILEEIRKEIQVDDPYQVEKENSSKLVKALIPEIEALIEKAEQPLLMATELAIAGNIIDYGAKNSFDIHEELDRIINKEEKLIAQGPSEFFKFESFKTKLKAASRILYIGDNVGEHYFDAQLIKQIVKINPDAKIHYATRGFPALNDVLVDDALEAKIDQFATVISSGSKLPGTVLSQCTIEFIATFSKADLIISKGQGNYETLSSESGKLFFLLMAKCPVIANDVGCNVREILLLENDHQ